ncbi:MAG: hypothetical protein QNL26_02895 [Acidimicrobiia bacterium]|nr:hypothetical protein [Acidimicrobiia bacterium]
MATKRKILRHRGDTFPIVIFLKKTDGTAFDVTGYTFKLTVSNSEAAPESADDLFSSVGSISDAAGGEVSFPIVAEKVAATGKHWHDIEMTKTSDSTIRTIQDGAFELEQDVSK